MNGTPRLDSAFPITPQTGPRAGAAGRSTPLQRARARQPLPRASVDGAAAAPAPVIPIDLVDTGSQRLAVASFYAALWAWRISDAWTLYASDDTESLWLFMKWVAIDGVFIFGLPAMRIPWLEWSSFAMTALFLVHATLDAMMMFQIGIPILYWMELLFKTFYDRELAIAERRVKPADVVDHASLFLGKQVINILPEG
jgi:nucleoporin POM152